MAPRTRLGPSRSAILTPEQPFERRLLLSPPQPPPLLHQESLFIYLKPQATNRRRVACEPVAAFPMGFGDNGAPLWCLRVSSPRLDLLQADSIPHFSMPSFLQELTPFLRRFPILLLAQQADYDLVKRILWDSDAGVLRELRDMSIN
ncbi:hypothetical protein KM043_012709 [Ampulex compressa]|nr:hypothetical protein KM043_012709 [Ampulex compressa]